MPTAGANGPVPLGVTTHTAMFSPHPPAPLGDQSTWAHLGKGLGWAAADPSQQAPQDQPQPLPVPLTCLRGLGSLQELLQLWCPLRPAELTPAPTAPGSRSFAPGAACKPLTHAPAS